MDSKLSAIVAFLAGIGAGTYGHYVVSDVKAGPTFQATFYPSDAVVDKVYSVIKDSKLTDCDFVGLHITKEPVSMDGGKTKLTYVGHGDCQ